jgi:protein-S-isoprenylcysteine O-methyltransferase Ste14
MKRTFFLLYGIICYLAFFGSFTYFMGFVDNILVPNSLDGEATAPLWIALLINFAAVAIFSLQHSIMARASFKKVWTRIVPEPIERSTYVLFSSLALSLMMFMWEPMGGMIWHVEDESFRVILTIVSLLGFGIVFISSFLINHFDLFGLRQVWLYFNKKPYTPLEFKKVAFYKYSRHPLYLGVVIAVWAAPTMTVAHLVFSLLITLYVLIGIFLEEKDMIRNFGETYRNYKKQVPKLVPIPIRRNRNI